MAYTKFDFTTKKAVRDALARRKKWEEAMQEATGPLGIVSPLTIGAVMIHKDFPNGEPIAIEVYQPGPFGPKVSDGRVALEGPHFPKPHRWYGEGMVKDGILQSIK